MFKEISRRKTLTNYRRFWCRAWHLHVRMYKSLNSMIAYLDAKILRIISVHFSSTIFQINSAEENIFYEAFLPCAIYFETNNRSFLCSRLRYFACQLSCVMQFQWRIANQEPTVRCASTALAGVWKTLFLYRCMLLGAITLIKFL